MSIAAGTTSALAQSPTPDQLRQLQELSPEQRAQLIDALGGQDSTKQEPLPEPTVVTPRRVAQPPLTSTEVQEGQGIDGLSDTAAAERSRPELRPFGYDLFAGEPTTFAPATDIPVPVDYVIGPGDTIELQLFGNQNASYTLVVTREGVLNFPELGPITVSGLRFSDLQSTLQQRVSEQMIGVRSSITMGRLRSIRIFVLGDAYRPGSYTVSALTTMTNALFVSGGINTIGSLRNIQLKRNGRLVTTLDLYDLLLRGDTSGDSRLQPGDVIFIPPVGKRVGVDGEVRRPALYELKGEQSVNDILRLAGNLLPTAYPKASQIERINERRERTIVNVDLSTNTGRATKVESDDVIRVYSVLEKREDVVTLAGHVHRDGAFEWRPGMRLTDLLPSLKELRPGADPGYILIRRELPESLRIDVLSADLSAALAAPGSAADVRLQPRDQLRVFSFNSNRSATIQPLLAEFRLQASRTEPTRVVSIAGRVRAPGHYPLESGMQVSDLIRAGGNLSEQAFALDAELTRYAVINGEYRATEIIDVDLDSILRGVDSADLRLAEHDFLRIDTVRDWNSEWSVTLQGEFRFPGEYRIRRGETLGQLLERAGGLTEEAFPEGAVFLRESLRKREQEQIAMLARRLEADLASLTLEERDSTGDDNLDTGNVLLGQLKSTEAVGRLVINLDQISAGAAAPDSVNDIELKDGDRLLVPTQSQVVTVIGETQQNASHLYQAGNSRDDYINMSGGLTRRADKKLIYVVRASG
ncbi:MAG: SLBB domain-containing protein, partial [Gammaproteobacteria bacterium]|nr:SLBB domain-containing protein [Gammaproteobacteria bacterium]